MNNFQLSVLEDGGKKVVDFSNNTNSFVEVVLDIDGRIIKGYCYPPFHHKPIRRARNGEALPFSKSGHIRAFVFSGVGQFKDDTDYEVPPWIRRKLYQNGHIDTDRIIQENTKRKVTFRRTSSHPVEVLEIPY
jgi:hypothetical protein